MKNLAAHFPHLQHIASISGYHISCIELRNICKYCEGHAQFIIRQYKLYIAHVSS